MTVNDLVAVLRFVVAKPVLDRTGLTDEYDIALRWAPEVRGVTIDPTDGASNAPHPTELTTRRKCSVSASSAFGVVAMIRESSHQVLDYPNQANELSVGFGGPPGDRTRDTLIKSQVLYH